MAQLSTELLLQILEDASGATLKSIRLTCRRFCLLVTPLLFRRIRFALHKDFIQPLVQVSRHKGLRQYVRELVYVTFYNFHPFSGCALKSGYDSPFYLRNDRFSLPASGPCIYEEAISKEILPALRRLRNVTKITLSNEVLGAQYNDNKNADLSVARRICASERLWNNIDYGLCAFMHTLCRSGLQIRDFSTMPGQDIKGIMLDTFRIDDCSIGSFRSIVRNLRSMDLWIRGKGLPVSYRYSNLSNVHSILHSATQLEILGLRLPEYFWYCKRDGTVVNCLNLSSWNRLQHVTLRKVHNLNFVLVTLFNMKNRNLHVLELHTVEVSQGRLETFLTSVAVLYDQPVSRFFILRSKSYIICKDDLEIDLDRGDVCGLDFRYDRKDNSGRPFTLRIYFDPKGSLDYTQQHKKYHTRLLPLRCYQAQWMRRKCMRKVKRCNQFLLRKAKLK